jgi:methylated-DNA-[protein]-cysteine S-methyltransferase
VSSPAAFALFATAIGTLGVAWSARGIAGVFLPEASDAATRRRIARRFPGARESVPPADVRRALDAIAALLRGERADPSEIPLDMSELPELHRRVYEVARTIAPGRTLSYGEIAARLGDKELARVLAADGKPGGFSARGGLATKLRLLSIEGVQMPGTLPLLAAAREAEERR